MKLLCWSFVVLNAYSNALDEPSGMNNCNSANAPGIAHYKPTIEDEALLDHEQHKRYRSIVGKPQWLAHTRPDIAYSTKELARDLTAPTELSQKRVKHLLRYLHGAKHYKFTIEPTTTLTANTNNYVIIQLQIEQQLLLRYLTSGQFIHFTRDYISYMMSVQQNYYLPTTTLPQTIYKVNYNMTIFTNNYSLRNNYLWNYHMPLLLPELLHYLYNRDQLHDYQHKAITTILCKSIQHTDLHYSP